MTFDYEVLDENDEVVETLTVRATFSPYMPAFTDGRPEHCYPAEGGELEDLTIYLDNKDITDKVDALYGVGTYDAIRYTAKDEYDPTQESDL